MTTPTREDEFEKESPKQYPITGLKPTESNDRKYLTWLLLREFDDRTIQEPSTEDYANELVNP
ncbi:MAG: hypothetical protein ABIM30_00595 [candidate division WOR-3 bacterium]